MVEFQEGTLDTLMERLCSGISGFDPEWAKRCVPATEEQIRQLKDILAEYNYTIPAAYLYYLKRMGQDDGGLLENEGDVCFYMKISNKEDNPMVTDWGGVYVTESFEKYLFRKAFRMYQRGFTYIDFQSNAGCDHPEKKRKKTAGHARIARIQWKNVWILSIRWRNLMVLKKRGSAISHISSVIMQAMLLK